MGNRAGRLVAILLLSSFCFSGCAYMTAQGRREMAYRHYLAKHMGQRYKQIAKAQKAANRKMKHESKIRPVEPTQPIVKSSVEPADQVSTPVTVSSSESTAPESPPQP